MGNQEKRRRRQEEASHRQHVPSLRWIPQKSGKEQTQQTPNRARKEEEDPCRAQKAPQHRPFGNRKTPRKSHRILDRLVRPRRGKYDQEQKINRQKYDINQLRQRVSEYMGKFSKNKRTIKVGTSVGAAKSAFK